MALTLVPSQVSQQLSGWYGTPQGQRLLQETEATVVPWLSGLTGYYAAELSYFNCERNWSSAERMRLQLSVTPLSLNNSHTVCDFTMLPFDTDSIDLVIVHHLFEFVENPHALLREIQRVLIPSGQCLIIAFNPFGIYGVVKPFKWRTAVPWRGNFFSSYRIRDWLSLLDFEINRMSYFAPPCFHLENSSSRLSWLPTACRQRLPVAGGLFAMLATKRVMSPLIKDVKWRAPAYFPGGKITQPTTSQYRKDSNEKPTH